MIFAAAATAAVSSPFNVPGLFELGRHLNPNQFTSFHFTAHALLMRLFHYFMPCSFSFSSLDQPLISRLLNTDLFCLEIVFLVGAFRRKTQTIVVTFLKTNELTDFINFISKH